MMRREEKGLDGPIGPRELASHISCAASVISDRRQWVGLEAIRYREPPPAEVVVPPLTHHTLVLFIRTPSELEVEYDGIGRTAPPRAGTILVVPSGTSSRWLWSGCFDSLHVFLEPGVIARVAAESFELDPARMPIPPLDGLDLPQLRAAMLAVGAELTADDPGGRLAVECLANLMAVQLIRHILAPRRQSLRPDSALSRRKLRDVVKYVERHLDAGLTLGRMAAVAHLSVYHFARQFKMATGLSPHQYVIARRVERAQQLLQGGGDLSLAQVAARAGFMDQSQFSLHFKRIVGVTPGQFRRSARIP